MATRIACKRIYEPKATGDGYRVLVDRLWPRGVAKANAAIDDWAKDLAPSTALRKWYHDGGDWEEFRRRYRAELRKAAAAVNRLFAGAGDGPVTLLYAARHAERNHAEVLAEFLRQSVPD